MSALLFIGGWLGIGFVVIAWNSYVEERPFREDKWSIEYLNDSFPLLFVMLGGPISFLWMLAKRVSYRARQAGKEKASLAAELRKELDAANREIDAMLKRERAGGAK